MKKDDRIYYRCENCASITKAPREEEPIICSACKKKTAVVYRNLSTIVEEENE